MIIFFGRKISSDISADGVILANNDGYLLISCKSGKFGGLHYIIKATDRTSKVKAGDIVKNGEVVGRMALDLKMLERMGEHLKKNIAIAGKNDIPVELKFDPQVPYEVVAKGDYYYWNVYLARNENGAEGIVDEPDWNKGEYSEVENAKFAIKLNGPIVVYTTYTTKWLENGILSRTDGPALVSKNLSSWYYKGEFIISDKILTHPIQFKRKESDGIILATRGEDNLIISGGEMKISKTGQKVELNIFPEILSAAQEHLDKFLLQELETCTIMSERIENEIPIEYLPPETKFPDAKMTAFLIKDDWVYDLIESDGKLKIIQSPHIKNNHLNTLNMEYSAKNNEFGRKTLQRATNRPPLIGIALEGDCYICNLGKYCLVEREGRGHIVIKEAGMVLSVDHSLEARIWGEKYLAAEIKKLEEITIETIPPWSEEKTVEGGDNYLVAVNKDRFNYSLTYKDDKCQLLTGRARELVQGRFKA